jgi:predicted DNA-binding protein
MEHGEHATYERLNNLCEQVVEALRKTRFTSATVSLSPRDGGHEIEFRTSTAMPPETEARIAALEAEVARAREAALEEAAKVAEELEFPISPRSPHMRAPDQHEITHAIRALKAAQP